MEIYFRRLFFIPNFALSKGQKPRDKRSLSYARKSAAPQQSQKASFLFAFDLRDL
jgi:hypothetical protein